jgi:hypothetical protein
MVNAAGRVTRPSVFREAVALIVERYGFDHHDAGDNGCNFISAANKPTPSKPFVRDIIHATVINGEVCEA